MESATLQLVLQGGALGVLVLVLVGLFVLMKLLVPAAREFLAGLVATMKQNGEAIVALSARLDLAEARIGAAIDRAANEVTGVVRERASHLADEVTDEIRSVGSTTGQFAAVAVDRPAAAPRTSGARPVNRGSRPDQ